MDIVGITKKFSKKGDFILYDWRDSGKEDFYLNDEMAYACFFIRDLHPRKILDEIFVNQMRDFKFNSGLIPCEKISGNVVNSDLKYLFAKFEFPKTAEFNWAGLNIKRDTKLSSFKRESDLMKYLSKYID